MQRLGMCSNNLNYTCKIRHHVFTTFDARIRNVKCKNKNVLEVLKTFLKSFFKILEYSILTFYISYTCVECGKDVMSYFARSSSYYIIRLHEY